MRARPYQPTDKPHAEGSFGLFKQACPPLVLRGDTPESLAMELARLVVTVWGRAVNHRPRNDRAGKSRAQLFADAEPTEEQRADARAALEERHRRAQKARETRARRMDPVVRELLDQALSRLGLEDPGERLRIAIASWPIDAIVEGIAIFEGKKKAGTLPEGADARYLRGIVKNVAQEREGWQIAVALLEERLRARDLAVIHLQRQRDALDEAADNFEDLVKGYVDKAMACQRHIDRTFWLLAVADTIQEAGEQQLLKLAARRITGTYSIDQRQRHAAIRLLFAKALPID
jgi:chromosome segregation ATPase